MDIYCDADDPAASLKLSKLRTIRLHRRPGMPYFGFGVSIYNREFIHNKNKTSYCHCHRYEEDANMGWDSLSPKSYQAAKASYKDYRQV